MVLKRVAERSWNPAGFPGAERSVVRGSDTGSRSSILRLVAGARAPRHVHNGGEEILVLSGTVRIGEVELAAGDYLFAETGEEHDLFAVTDASIFVSSERPPTILEG